MGNFTFLADLYYTFRSKHNDCAFNVIYVRPNHLYEYVWACMAADGRLIGLSARDPKTMVNNGA